MRPKVAIFSEHGFGQTGGIQRLAQKVCQYVSEFEMIPLTMGPGGVPIRQAWGLKRWAWPQDFRQTLAYYSPALVHVNGFSSIAVMQMIEAATSLQIPVLYAPAYHPFKAHRRPALAWGFFQGVSRWVIPRVRAILCLTQTERQFLTRYFPSQFFVLPAGQDFDRGATDLPVQRDLRQVIFVGRAESSKGYHLLEQGIPSEFHLTVVTSNTQAILNRPNTTLARGVSDDELYHRLQQSSFLLMPSAYESFGLSALEGLAMGVLPVLSDQVGLREYLPAELYAEFPWKAPEQLPTALRALAQRISIQEAPLRQKAIALARSLSWANYAQELEKIYHSLLS